MFAPFTFSSLNINIFKEIYGRLSPCLSSLFNWCFSERKKRECLLVVSVHNLFIRKGLAFSFCIFNLNKEKRRGL